MKIAIASFGKSLDSQVDWRFGRCSYFLIVETKTGEFEAIKNTASQASHGAGVSAAQIVADKGVKAVLAGNFGPKAVYTLGISGIKLYSLAEVKAKEALRKFKEGKLKEVKLNQAPFRSRGGWRGF